jgi:hypothetical protein
MFISLLKRVWRKMLSTFVASATALETIDERGLPLCPLGDSWLFGKEFGSALNTGLIMEDGAAIIPADF